MGRSAQGHHPADAYLGNPRCRGHGALDRCLFGRRSGWSPTSLRGSRSRRSPNRALPRPRRNAAAAEHLEPGQGRRTQSRLVLDRLLGHYGIPKPAGQHRAVLDAKVTAQVPARHLRSASQLRITTFPAKGTFAVKANSWKGSQAAEVDGARVIGCGFNCKAASRPHSDSAAPGTPTSPRETAALRRNTVLLTAHQGTN